MSSSAQLSLVPWLLRWPQPEDRTTFLAGLHAGSAVGLAAALRPGPKELRTALVVALPAAAVGAVGHDLVERRLGRPGPTAALLALGGAALWVADRRSAGRRADKGDLAAASAAQVVALAPGVSRAGATLTALRARGVDRGQAVRESMVMSLPIALGAAGLTAVRAKQAPPLVPSVLAGATAYAAARRLAPTRAFVTGTVLYRLGLAAAVAARLRRER